MCACNATFTCSKCKDTPFDPRYEEDAYEPMSEPDFDDLVAGPVVMWEGWV